MSILLIDDDIDVAMAVSVLLRRAGIACDHAADAERAYALIAAQRFDAVLLDLNLTRGNTSGEEGFAILRRLLDADPDVVVIVITAHSGIRTAVSAMRNGARDFVMKPWRNAELLERIEAAIAYRQRLGAIADLREAMPTDADALIGESRGIERVRDLIRRIGPTRAGVLVTGPPGSGRMLVARELHRARCRDDAAMTVIDARLLAAGVDPAMLAGASGGTLLLRHVDRLDETAQVRLADALPAEARPIATAAQGSALIPLLHSRLGTIEIAVPPLARRGDDALLIARHLARRAEQRHARPFVGFTVDAEQAILAGPWPDEVRGLAMVVERALLLSDGGEISAEDLGLGAAASSRTVAAPPAAKETPTLADAEREMVAATLNQHGFNVSHAAAALGLSRAALYRRMAKYGL